MRHRKTEIWAKWRGLVSEQSQSGQSVAAFCSERGLRSGQFFAWKKKLREAEAAKFVAVEVTPVAEAKWPASVVSSGAIEVRLGRGRSLVVESGFDARHLRALLSVLEAEA
jgi:transposase-like protein